MCYKGLPSGKYSSDSPVQSRLGAVPEGKGTCRGDLAPEGAQKDKSQVGTAQRKAVVMQAQPG